MFRRAKEKQEEIKVTFHHRFVQSCIRDKILENENSNRGKQEFYEERYYVIF